MASQPPPIEPKVDLEKKQLAEEVAALKSEVKKWKGEAEDAKCVPFNLEQRQSILEIKISILPSLFVLLRCYRALAGQAHGDSQSVAETKAKDLAKKVPSRSSDLAPNQLDEFL